MTSNEVYLSELHKVKRSPVFGDLEGSTRNNLASFIQSDFVPHLRQSITDYHQSGKWETQILVMMGDPGVGKTRLRKNTEGAVMSNFGGLERFFKRITWERHGEWAARQARLITTDIQKPYTIPELAASNEKIEQTTRRVLKEKPIFVSLEVPGTTSTIAEGAEKGRPLGFNLLYQLAHKEEPFKRLNYRLHIVGLTGGPILREVMVYFRDALNNPKIDFQQAAELAYLSGQIKNPKPHLSARQVPKEEYLKKFTKTSWKTLQNGASVEQIELIEQTTRDLATYWIDQGRITLPSRSLFKYVYPLELSSLSTDRVVSNNAYERWAIPGALMHHIIFDDEQFGMKDRAEQVFLGYYDPIIIFPAPDALPPKLTEIEEDIEERKRAA